ncbi:MAG: HAMP domain-containing sensor histidine kinase [Actinomycetota bacterium]|nr:HAMP domain-containing sensor histidine kinase [Actinomycetota bacterium]
MRRSSLRSWLLIVSILFAALVIGGVALTTYVVVSDGMAMVARGATASMGHAATEALKSEITAGKLAAAAEGLEGPAREREALRLVMASMPRILTRGVLQDGEAVLYVLDPATGELEATWSSSDIPLPAAAGAQRDDALSQRQTIEVTLDEGSVIRGLVGPVRLGVFVLHVPVDLPADTRGVLDLAYFPVREEAVIDAIRLPMSVLAVSAMLVMVLMMQTSMGWVLKLVDDLRRAADAIDAGNLDLRLPDQGEHEIGDLARSINGLIERLRLRAEAQTRFVADASHELATPVAGIRGYTNILRAWGGEDPEVREEAISAIDRESRRMARLCSDLLALVRSERAIQFKNVRFDVSSRCRQVLAAAATRYIDKGLEFVGPDEGQLMMVGDPDRIEDVVSILVDNAAKYTPLGGSVGVSVRRRREVVLIEISDTGIGIPERDIPNIFDRFYRSDASRSKETGGFGLGLPIAKSVVDAIGGTIEVKSVGRAGSTFTVRLPRGRL